MYSIFEHKCLTVDYVKEVLPERFERQQASSRHSYTLTVYSNHFSRQLFNNIRTINAYFNYLCFLMCEFKVTALIRAESSLMKLQEERHPTIAERNNQQVRLVILNSYSCQFPNSVRSNPVQVPLRTFSEVSMKLVRGMNASELPAQRATTLDQFTGTTGVFCYVSHHYHLL